MNDEIKEFEVENLHIPKVSNDINMNTILKYLEVQIDEYSLDGRYIKTWDSIVSAALNYDVAPSIIIKCCLGSSDYSRKPKRIFVFKGDGLGERVQRITRDRGSKKIFEYNSNGDLIRIYQSITEASRFSGLSKIKIYDIAHCAPATDPIGRIFTYEEENIEDRLQKIRSNKFKAASRRVILEYSKNGTYIKEWLNAAMIQAAYDITKENILKVCFGELKSIDKKIFLFKGDSIEERLKKIINKKKNPKV